MVASLEHPELMLGEKMLKKVWSYPVDFCIRFRTIPDNLQYILDRVNFRRDSLKTRRSVEHCTPHADGAWLNELGWS